ncbi:retinoic acid receptor responder protein 2-like, partial [Gastrophryne carolinensis]
MLHVMGGIARSIPVEELSEVQNKAVKLVMEHLHKRDYLKNGFKLASVVTAAQEEYLSGIFVRVEFIVKQTTCHRDHWGRTDCAITKNPNSFNCFGCYKFEYETHQVISQAKECILPKYMNAERTGKRSSNCREVELKDNGKRLIGTFSFLKS